MSLGICICLLVIYISFFFSWSFYPILKINLLEQFIRLSFCVLQMGETETVTGLNPGAWPSESCLFRKLFYSGRAALQRAGEKPRFCSMASPSLASKLATFPAESFLHPMTCCRESCCIMPLCMLPLLAGILSCFFPHSQSPLTHHSLITQSC